MNKSRFDFLDEVAAEPQPVIDSIATSTPASTTPITRTAYLYQAHSRTEPLAPLGNRVRLPAKHILEDFVRDLKRAGHPATETRALEALMLLLAEDAEVRARVAIYLTGSEELTD